MARARFVQATGLVAVGLKRAGLVGIVMPWRAIYYLDNWNKCPTFIRHEMVHIEQIERYGAIRFTIVYLYYLARYGYRENPLEKEAYDR